MSAQKTVVLYHANCTDGLVSALCYYVLMKEQIKSGLKVDYTFIPIQYNEALPADEILEGADIFVLDFSFSVKDTNYLVELGSTFTMLDHHQTAVTNLFVDNTWDATNYFTEVNEYTGEGVYLAHSKTARMMIDKRKSGAMLAFESVDSRIQDFAHWDLLRYICEHTQDRDLWKFKLKDTRAVYEYLQQLGKDVESLYTFLFEADQHPALYLEKQVEKAQTRVDMRLELATSYASKAKMVDFMEYKIPVVNVPSNFSSEVGNILAKDHPFALMFVVASDKLICSLRSNGKTGENVELIAKRFGGGGHQAASGFSIPVEFVSDLVQGKIHPITHSGLFVKAKGSV
jgi:oligoribonuclease NrnB/cAMP/cGMP phosphodiesterase (DHH superfamily)